MSRLIIYLIMLTRASLERRLIRNLTGAMKRKALGIYTYVVAGRLRFDAVGGGIEHWLARPGGETR